MSKGLKIASWAVAISIIVLCDGCFLAMVLLTWLEDVGGELSTTLSVLFADVVAPLLFLLIPLLQIVSIVLGIVAASMRSGNPLRTTRAITLTFKIGLMPFFICGAVLGVMFFVVGFFPLFPVVGWVVALFVGVMGWLTMFSGSIWAIATAVQLRKRNAISGGETAAHIACQCIFLADVIDGIVLFVRSKGFCDSANFPKNTNGMVK